MVQPTPSGKRRAADDLGVLSAVSPNRSKFKRAITTGAPMKASGQLGQLARSKTMKTYSTKTLSMTLGNQSGDVLDTWDVPGSSPLTATNTSASVEKQSSSFPDAHSSGDRLSKPRAPQRTINENCTPKTSGDTIEDRDSQLEWKVDPTEQHVTQSQPWLVPALQEGFGAHNPNLLFPDQSSTIVDSSSSGERRGQGAPFKTEKVETSQSLTELKVGKKNASSEVTTMISTWDLECTMEKSYSFHGPTDNTQYPSIHERAATHTEALVVISRRTSPSQVADTAVVPKTKRKRKLREDNSADELNFSDEIVIGLPKEQYKPRPSRSRSARIPQPEPIQSVTEPEKKVKATSKRRKTTDGVIMSSRMALREMGFPSSQADEAMEGTDGTVAKAVEWLTCRSEMGESGPRCQKKIRENPSTRTTKQHDQVEQITFDMEQQNTIELKSVQGSPITEDIIHVERASKIKTVKGPGTHGAEDYAVGRGQSAAGDEEVEREVLDTAGKGDRRHSELRGEATNHEDGSDIAENHGKNLDRHRAQNVSSEERLEDTKQSRRKPNATHTADDQIAGRDGVDEIVEPQMIEVEEHQEVKKKGRGRPKRAPKTLEKDVAPDNTIVSKISTHEPSVLDPNCKRLLQDLESTEETSDKASPSADAFLTGTPPEGGSKDKLPQTKTPERSVGSPKKQHSPLNKGQVPLKVGLSKKNRIPSLLRSIKR